MTCQAELLVLCDYTYLEFINLEWCHVRTLFYFFLLFQNYTQIIRNIRKLKPL